MVIAEAKFRPPPDWQQFAEARRVREIYGISPLMAINKRDRSRGQQPRPALGRPSPTASTPLHHSLAMMIDQANSNLQLLGHDIHISLVQHQDSFALDIYDCSSGKLCALIGEEEVTMAQLPTLLVNLQEQAGLLIDVQS